MGRISPRSLIRDLPLAERQRIEILCAMEDSSKVLILDEPTASLAETDWLFDLIRERTATGIAVLYISHRLPEVRELANHGPKIWSRAWHPSGGRPCPRLIWPSGARGAMAG